jgi:predicted transcriptional regulator YdeE
MYMLRSMQLLQLLQLLVAGGTEMNKSLHGILMGCSIALVAALPASSQEITLKPEQLTAVREAVSRPVPVKYIIVKEDFTGEVQGIKANIEKFMRDAKEQKLDVALQKTESTGLLIYRDNPDEKRRFSYSVGFTIPERMKVEAPLSIQTLQYSAAVRVTHQGSNYEELGSIYRNIDGIQAKKTPSQRPKFPVVLEFQKDPGKIPPDQVMSRLVVPVGDIREE